MTVLLLISIQLTVFGILIFILKGVIQRHFGEASSRLETLTKESEDRLTEAKKKVKEADLYYEDVLARTKEEGGKIRQQLIDEGLKEKQELIDHGRKEADAIMERARSARKLLEENWDEELSTSAREVTFRVLQTVLPAKVHPALQSEWIKDSLESDFDGLGNLNVAEPVTHADVVTAIPFTETQKRALAEKLHVKLGRKFEIRETTDETLILGFCVSLGAVVIDSSLAWKLKETLRNERPRKDH